MLFDNVDDAFAAHPDITFEGFLFKQGAADMQNRTLAVSWGERYLTLVDDTRGLSFIPNDLTFVHASPRVGEFPDDLTGFDPDSVPSPEPSRPYAVHVVVEQWNVHFERPGINVTIMRDIPVGEDGVHSTPDGIRTEGRNFAETYANLAT